MIWTNSSDGPFGPGLVPDRRAENSARYFRRTRHWGSLSSVDALTPADVSDTLAERHRVARAQNGVYPALFACPNLVLRDENRGLNVGGAFVMSPWSKAVAG